MSGLFFFSPMLRFETTLPGALVVSSKSEMLEMWAAGVMIYGEDFTQRSEIRLSGDEDHD